MRNESGDFKFTREDDGSLKLLGTTDATVWAQEFCRVFSVFADDGVVQDKEGLMLSWFANAIETGRSAGTPNNEDA